MTKNLKRIVAALLVVIGGLMLVQLTEDKFIRMFIVACILFAATYMNKRALKRQDMSKLHARLEKELEEEERLAQEQQQEGIDINNKQNDEEDEQNSSGSVPKE